MKVNFVTEVSLYTDKADEDGEPSPLFQEILGSIVSVDPETDKSIKIGTVSATLFNYFRSQELALSMFYEADKQNPEFAGFIATIEGSKDIFLGSVLLIQKIQIRPKYRGKGIGNAVITRAVDIFLKGEGHVFLEPFPLDQSGKGDTKKLRSGRKTLTEYYAKMGFAQFEHSAYMFFDASLRQPCMLLERYL